MGDARRGDAAPCGAPGAAKPWTRRSPVKPRERMRRFVSTGAFPTRHHPSLREEGANIVLVLTIVDRLEGAKENFDAEGLAFRALYTADEFLRAS